MELIINGDNSDRKYIIDHNKFYERGGNKFQIIRNGNSINIVDKDIDDSDAIDSIQLESDSINCLRLKGNSKCKVISGEAINKDVLAISLENNSWLKTESFDNISSTFIYTNDFSVADLSNKSRAFFATSEDDSKIYFHGIKKENISFFQNKNSEIRIF